MSEGDKRVVVGVDPGVSGAIVVLDYLTGDLLMCEDMPSIARTLKNGKKRRMVSAEAIAKIMREVRTLYWDVVALAIEQVGALGNGSIASFSLGHSAGVVKGVAAGLGYPLIEIPPREWKKYFNLLGTPKGASREAAKELYPRAPLSSVDRADAMLIGRYALEERIKE